MFSENTNGACELVDNTVLSPHHVVRSSDSVIDRRMNLHKYQTTIGSLRGNPQMRREVTRWRDVNEFCQTPDEEQRSGYDEIVV
jgi:hypothetical protein